MADNLVRFRQQGSLLVVETLTPQLRGILEQTLTYNHLEFLRGQRAAEIGKSMLVHQVPCYRYQTDPHGVLPTVMVTASGYLKLLAKTLREQGFRPVLKDVTPRDRDWVFEPDWSRVADVNFRWMQREVLELMIKSQGGRICCPTGYGKSFLIRNLAKLLPKARIDVTTHSLDVIRQIYNDLKSHLPSVGFVGGGKKKTEERVMCYSGKSLHHSDARADILIVDECHETATADYMRKIGRYRLSRKFGFSANNDDRADGADFQLLGAFGPLLINLSYEDAVAHGCIVPIEVYWHDVFMDANPCEGYVNDVQKLRWGIWRNDVRNQVIADAVRGYPDDQVLVTVATVEHAVFLKSKLPEFTLVYREDGMSDRDRASYIDWGLLTADEPRMTWQRRAQLKDDFSAGKLRKVIATSVWNRGVDFQQLAVLARADGMNSAIADTQIPGRVARKHAATDKQVGVILDFRDQFDKRFGNRAQSRERRYSEKGWRNVFPEYSTRFSRFLRT